ncbi:MAG: hypothetical protein EBT70_12015 [Betaproteobacteria bacterium]|nr:hypothetical protein [Betaproteobacteria bacterium]
MSLYQQMLDQQFSIQFFQQGLIKRFEPKEIRETIQVLLGKPEHHPLAQALGDAGMAMYPESEDMLAICGLLAAIREDWEMVIEHLLMLLAIREQRTDALTYKVLVHALKQRMEYEAALNVLTLGLQHHPDTPELVAEVHSLNQMVNAMVGQKRVQ